MSARAIAAAIAAVAVAWPLAEAALAGPDAPDVPAEIVVAEGHKVFLVAYATGVQIYSCNGTAWTFVAPRANLYDARGKLIGTHFGGPTWQARDGSTVVARLDSRVTVDPTAIPWLRLVATSATAGPDGGRLEGTTFIQRTATAGGLAPAAATCTAETAGTVQEVDYTANYHFWKQTGG